MTVPELFAAAHNKTPRTGPHRCYYCGALCDGSNESREYVKSSFTGIDTVTAQHSPAVCDGCVMCLDERRTITTHDGQRREGQRVRGYSWILSPAGAVPCTKADREFIRATCLAPPIPPYAISISDSGQKQLLYRGVVNHSRDVVTVTLEGERISYRQEQLAERIRLVMPLIAATGKPALEEGLSVRQRMTCTEECGEEAVSRWKLVCGEPLTTLAIWLSPGKEGCINERDDTGHGTVAAEAGGAD